MWWWIYNRMFSLLIFNQCLMMECKTLLQSSEALVLWHQSQLAAQMYLSTPSINATWGSYQLIQATLLKNLSHLALSAASSYLVLAISEIVLFLPTGFPVGTEGSVLAEWIYRVALDTRQTQVCEEGSAPEKKRREFLCFSPAHNWAHLWVCVQVFYWTRPYRTVVSIINQAVNLRI